MTDELPSYPLPRSRCPFDPPPEYEAWREAEGITKVKLWDGRTSWVVTRLEYFRQILGDTRFSVNWSHPGMPSISEATSAPIPTRLSFLRMDDPEHARLRRMVARDFAAPRIEEMRPRIQEHCDQLLDDMERKGPPADLVADFAMALPSLVACEILGVPYEDHDNFQSKTRTMLTPNNSREDVMRAAEELGAYLSELIHKKKGKPGTDTYSRLINTYFVNGNITEQECVITAILLLIGGHETTANQIAMSTLLLAEHPDQLAEFRANDDPAFVANAVENLLRYMSIIENNLNRVATADVEVDGHLIRAGEGVILNVPAANRDPRAFHAHAKLDLGYREQEKHASFGHGVHQCLGQILARAELQISLKTLLRRMPNIAPTVPLAEVDLKSNPLIVGLNKLPVTW
ncbi:cytochrome P450 [Nocardia sp. NPDC004278]